MLFKEYSIKSETTSNPSVKFHHKASVSSKISENATTKKPSKIMSNLTIKIGGEKIRQRTRSETSNSSNKFKLETNRNKGAVMNSIKTLEKIHKIELQE